jgi:hypothetical protein
VKKSLLVSLVSMSIAAVSLSACSSGQDDATATQTVTERVTEQAPAVVEAAAPETPAEAAPAEDLTIPDGLEGTNGQLAYERLKDAGFTGVVPTSVDPTRAMPIMYNNWTVTSVEPGAGTTVPADSTVILNMTKE